MGASGRGFGGLGRRTRYGGTTDGRCVAASDATGRAPAGTIICGNAGDHDDGYATSSLHNHHYYKEVVELVPHVATRKAFSHRYDRCIRRLHNITGALVTSAPDIQDTKISFKRTPSLHSMSCLPGVQGFSVVLLSQCGLSCMGFCSQCGAGGHP